ncbi:hypothetical protein Snoj_64810 [Streptomyces nojiriensis]|uniref:Uncharacterized protein n=1 Tax=Streptomyces nojiriensis TaxID=66374 RepID=A0ABQ3SWQ2_9ACTN|nr:hypothetical protein [Streptomyces nojiriensis]QTI46089.1 hypothetical protein JYK04_03900 [Streptomyces nojiriensis]GHI72563.1 hypothetical protein Snoj_64810 [Streptomyces nojiriensis]
MAQVTRVPQATDRGWWASAPGAEAVFAGQLLIGLALFVVLPEPDDGFELTTRGDGLLTYLVAGAVVVPAVLLGIGFLHAFVFTRPALALARRTGETAAAPAWLLGMSAACALLLWRAGGPFLPSLAWIAGSGVLPLLVAGLALRTTRSCGWVATAAYATSGVLALATLVGGPYAADRAAADGYEPPRWGQPQYAGTWRGEGGGTVRLREGGELAVEDLPVNPGDGSAVRCTATGTWRERPADPRSDRRAGVELTVGGCPGWQTQWQEAGPAGRRPELHPVGNTGPGSVRPLWRSGPPDVLLAP